MADQQIPALAIQQVNDVFPGTIPRIAGGGLTLFSRQDGKSAYWDTASAGGLPLEFFIDPSIAQNNFPRFKTVQAASDYATANNIPNGVIELAPGVTFVGNVTMPTSGSWEITSPQYQQSTIQGNIIVSNGGSATYTFTDIAITGDITGANSGSANSKCRMFGVLHSGNQALSVSGTGVWQLNFGGIGGNFNGASGYSLAGSVSVIGAIIAHNWSFFGNVTYTTRSRFNFVAFNAGIVVTANATVADTTMISCLFAGGVSLVGTGTPILAVDGHTMTSLGNQTALTAVSGFAFKTNNANGSFEGQAGPINSTQYLMSGPGGLYSVRASTTLITSGGTGTLLLDVNYVDATGTAKTLAVTTTGLVLNGTVGIEDAAATRPFYHNGSTPITMTIKGVGTGGSVVKMIGQCRREN